MNRFLLLFLLLLPLITEVKAQQEDVEKLFDDAEFFYATDDYKEAAYLFRKLIGQDPENANYNYLAGISLLNIPGEETKAIPFLEKAVQQTTLRYNERDADEKKAPYHAWFYLGNAYRINNQLDEALEAYSHFMDLRDFERKYNIRIVQNEIKAVERAKIIKDAPVNIIKMKLPFAVNNGSTTYRPVVDLNESSMVYLKELKFYDAIMYTWKVDGQWVKPVNITPQIGSDGDMTPSALSADGSELLLVKTSRSGDGDIYRSTMIDHKWSRAVPLGRNINTSRNEAHASFTSNGRLLIASDRRGGVGGLDIYIAEKDGNGEWKDPVNIGPEINTPEDENSAFLVNDDKTLYFTSKGHFNMGGYDIFYSNLGKNGIWNEPKNIGYPLNTTNDNNFYQPTHQGKTGFIALFTDDDSPAPREIYRIEILPFTQPATISKSLFNGSFNLILDDPDAKDKITISYDSGSDTFTVISPGGKSYNVDLERKK